MADLSKVASSTTVAASTTVASSITVDDSTVVQAKNCVIENPATGCVGCNQWRLKYADLKMSFLKLSLLHSNQSMKYEELVTTRSSITDSIAVERSDNTVGETLASTNDVFTENEVKYLNCIPLTKNSDSTFVLHCIRYAYKDNEAILLNRTLKGTLDRIEINDDGSRTVRPGKGPLTPEKVKRIEKLFIERVSKDKCLASEFGDRIKQANINKLIASAIKNVSNKAQPNEALPNKNADLNL